MTHSLSGRLRFRRPGVRASFSSESPGLRRPLIIENPDDEQPSCRDHVTSVGHDGNRCNIETGQVTEEKEGRTDHLSQVYEASANYPRDSQTITHPDGVHVASDENRRRNATDYEQFCAYCPMVLTSHEHKRTAHENQGQARQSVDGSMTMGCIDGDRFDVERHRHKNQAGQRDCACSDQKEKIRPLPRPENIGCNHHPIVTSRKNTSRWRSECVTAPSLGRVSPCSSPYGLTRRHFSRTDPGSTASVQRVSGVSTARTDGKRAPLGRRPVCSIVE